MKNVDSNPDVSKSSHNADGGYTYTVIFPESMKNVPELEVFSADIPVTVETIEDGNVLSGTFRLEFDGEMTTEIPFDADALHC